MATLTTQQVLQAGAAPTTQAAAGGGDKITPGDNVWLEVTNGGGSPITVTVNCVTPSNYGTDEDLVVSVTNGTTRRIGPIDARRFAAADGLAAIAYSGVTTVTVAAWKI
jgi:hypothetical protein